MLRRIQLWLFASLLAVLLVACNRQQSAEQTNEEPNAQSAARSTDAEQQARKAAETAQEARSQARDAEKKADRAEDMARDVARRNGANGSRSAARSSGAARVQSPELPAGAELRVRLDQPLDSDKNTAGDKFTATLAEPVVVNGRAVLPRGTRFDGSVTTAESSGRLSGKAVLTVKLDSFELNGKRYRINSTTASRISDGHKKRNIGIIGGGAAAGAAIGGITGGGKGAAIGAGAGAAAGAAGAAATGKKDVRLPAETVMVFTLQQPVNLG